MRDERLVSLARTLVEYSVALKAGEHLLINCTADEEPLAREVIRQAYRLGAFPHLHVSHNRLMKEVLLDYSAEAAKADSAWETARMREMDAYINMVTSDNPLEFSDVPPERMSVRSGKVGREVQQEMVRNHVKWCVAIYPRPMYAYAAGMSLNQFEDYYFKVCCLDYHRLGLEMDKLRDMMERTREVRVVSPGTDVTFSIEGIPKMSSKGERNLPDGEVYTAPVRESLEGTIAFNVPSIWQGFRFERMALTFKQGRVVDARANDTARLNAVLDTDEGARYTGEFAFGVNPFLTRPAGMTLFDEKIRGSVHFALGNALDLTDNGNRSAIHWDLVSILREEYGGGTVYFDKVPIQKNGHFLPEELRMLNEQTY